ncbi:MAG: ATP-binding protein [Oscillospiraceae bacterium]
MQKILGYLRRAITQYNMLSDGDKVAVGVSGGKDSVLLAAGLQRVREFIGIDFSIIAVTLDPCFENIETDYSPVTEYLNSMGIEHIIRRTNIGDVVFDIRKESNPCSLCARMRRGVLHDVARENGCNIIALGHHSDDAVETFVMNLFNEGRVGCFRPVTYLSRKDVTVIRPLCLTPENEIQKVINRLNIPVVKNSCPIDGKTERQWTKDFLVELEKEHKGVRNRLFGAMIRGDISGWGDQSKPITQDDEI